MTARLTRLLVPLASAALLLVLACTGGEAKPTSTATSSAPTTTAAATASATGSAAATATSGAATPTPTASATATAAVVLATPAAPTAAAPAVQPQRAPAPIVTSAPPPPAPTNASSDISGFAYGPASVTRGGSVTWVNRDPVQHDVVAKDGSFRSPILEPGQSYSARFDAAGTFAYVCSIHPFMAGTVVVQ